MNSPLAELREQAIALRRAGKSRREIKHILQIGSNQTLNEALRGEPPLMSMWRPNAKDDLRAKARELRQQGLVYNEIAAKLGVSKSSVSLWVRDLPRPERLSYEECAKRQAAAVAAYWLRERQRREAAREHIRAGEQHAIGQLSDREVLIAGAIAHMCEGTKSKPYRRSGRVIFINSDPRLISFYLRFLRLAGVKRDQLTFQVSIHESADVPSAQEFWRQVTQADPVRFRRPNLKRHNPKTTRLNVGSNYHGCLRIEVLRSGPLYKRIEGWCDAVMAESSTQSRRQPHDAA
jgi:transcriptional regulator with XRE-family HTH domain